MKTLLLLLFLLGAASLEAASSSQALKDKGAWEYWLKLLHYQKGKSLADGKEFFLSPQGKTDPEAELSATLEAFQDEKRRVGHFKLHPLCAFPERFRFLKSQGLSKLEGRSCEDFLEWKKGLNAQSLTLVFSTAFPNDPSSMFGHTFLRFNQGGEKKNDLLDYGVNYSAFIPEENPNPFEYAFKGLFGGYPGYFDFAPYYMKVNEYINAESRDLYEYDLDIPPEAIDRLVNHLWEIYATTYFDYYFIDENCSYLLADLLGVARPDWELTKEARFFYLPSDLIKKIHSLPGAVTKINYRPSLQKKFLSSLKRLSPREKESLGSLLEGRLLPREVKEAALLDSLILKMEMLRNKTRGKMNQKDEGLYREALLSRAGLKEKGEGFFIEDKAERRPEYSHEPQRLSLSSFYERGEASLGLSYRVGPHNQMANDEGLEPYNHFEFLALDAAYKLKNKNWLLNQLQFLRLISLFPDKEFDSRLSWQVGAQVERIREESCLNCQRLSVDGALGKTLDLGRKNIFVLMLGTYGEGSTHYERALRLGPYVEVSFLGTPLENFKYKIYSKLKADALGAWKRDYVLQSGALETFSLRKNMELRLEENYWTHYRSFKKQSLEYKLDLAFYL